MQIEVVLQVVENGTPTHKTLQFEAFSTAYNESGEILSILNEEEECFAEIRNWVYWRKTAD